MEKSLQFIIIISNLANFFAEGYIGLYVKVQGLITKTIKFMVVVRKRV